jgi:hypothetical protein
MAEPAIKPMTLDEFLRWDDGTETHYELIGGFPVAMAPPAAAHRMLATRLVSRIDFAWRSGDRATHKPMPELHGPSAWTRISKPTLPRPANATNSCSRR